MFPKKTTEATKLTGNVEALIENYCEIVKRDGATVTICVADADYGSKASPCPSSIFLHGPTEVCISMLHGALMQMLNDEKGNGDAVAAQAILRTVAEHPKLLNAIKTAMPLMEIMGALKKAAA